MSSPRDGTDAGGDGVTRVLLVDSDSVTVRLLTLAFDEFREDIEVQVATETRESFAFLDDGLGPPRPDVVVLDAASMGLGGCRVLRAIRERGGDLPPVIVFSRNADPTIVQECYELGATAYLVKPHDYEGLKAVVEVASRAVEGAECGAVGLLEAN